MGEFGLLFNDLKKITSISMGEAAAPGGWESVFKLTPAYGIRPLTAGKMTSYPGART